MQAVVMDHFGGPNVLHLADRPRPEPKPGEVLVRTRCVGVNYIDAAPDSACSFTALQAGSVTSRYSSHATRARR